MSTDTDALTERIEVSAREVMSRSALIADVDLPAYLAAAVLPIVETEVRKAKAEALREAAERAQHELGWENGGHTSAYSVRHWLDRRAAEHETGDRPMTTTPSKFRKKPIEIEAMKFGPTAPDAHALTCWMEDNLYPGLVGDATEPETLRYPDQVRGDNSRPDKGWYIDPATGDLMVRTLEGDMRVSPGDYVIRGVNGEFYPCKAGIFWKTYEAVTR